MALLALLNEGPLHGYQLKTQFQARTGGALPLNVGQVYTTLDRLERDGYVVPVKGDNGDRGQRAFAITSTGRKELGAWLATGSGGEALRDELLVKVLIVAAADPNAGIEVISTQRTALFAKLQAHRRAQPAGDIASELMHDALAARAEANLRWLDRCEERLKELAGRHNGRAGNGKLRRMK